MTAARLLRLYPRAWRERYADEFLEMVGPDRLQLQQVIDIASGAIDAWLSSDVRGATRVPVQGETVMVKSISVCGRNETRYTKRDGIIGATVMIAATLGFVAIGQALQLSGFPVAAKVVLNSSFLCSMTLSMPFWLMKGQPRRVQVAILGGTMILLLLINLAAALV